MKHVIVGAGAAGIAAAKTIRAMEPHYEIVLISEDENVISRCMLHKYISGERTIDALNFVPEDFFKEYRIQRHRGIKMTGVDTNTKTIYCGEEKFSYDKLLIATGATSVIPPIGALRTAKNVFGLRHLSDAKAIREAAMKAQHVVVLGAGLVGLDAAYALLGIKKEITVVEMAPRVLALNLDERAAAAYQERFEAAGCQFHLGRKVTDTVENDDGNVAQIVLDDGSVLPCDLLIVAAGVRPEMSFLERNGIAYSKAIIVDRYMATSCSDVYAAGDVTGLSGTWPNAMRQGEIAARNMCGEKKIYDDSFAAKNTINFFGLVTLSVGTMESGEGDRVVQREDRRIYQKIIVRDGYVTGLIMQGDISNSGFWQYFVKNRIRVDAVNKPIWRLSFADFCSLDEKGEYRWVVV
jgi:NAD(P)H-nitrite reductase large subunit